MDVRGHTARDEAQLDERESNAAWRFAQALLGNPDRSNDATAARRRAERERLEWLASISTEHEAQLRAFQTEEANRNDARREELAAFVESLTGVACEWDASKHPRGAFSQNRGWFSPTSGSRSSRKASQQSHSPTASPVTAHEPGSSIANKSGNLFDAIIKRNDAVADLTGVLTPGMVRSSRLAVDLDSASRLGGEVERAAIAGFGTGGKAVVNGLANAIKNTVTLGLSDTQIELLAVTQDDRDRGYDSAMAIATASGEILIAVGTAGMTTALKGGGTLVRTASGALTVFDAAGNAVGVIKGTYDATQNGVNLSNGAQVAGGALGLSGSAAALKGLAAPKPPTHVRPEGRNISARATTVPTKQATAAGVGANVDVDDFVAQLPRKRTPTKTQANQYEIRHTGAYNYEISGNGAEFYMDGYRGNTILEAKCVEKPLESPYVPGSSCYERVRERVLNDVRDELRRIRIIIDSKSTPFERIEFITNSPEAKKLFEQLLREFQLPGEVQIRS